MVKFSENLVSFALLGILVVATIGFIVSLQEDNDLTTTIRDDSIINNTYVDLSDALNDSQASATSGKDAFESEEVDRGFGFFFIFAIVGVVKTLTGMVVGIYNIIFVLPAQKLGIPQFIMNTIGAIFLALLVLQAWRVYRAGD